ncbi:putative uncharacterized protein C7orf78 homolog [Mixophyes fleayi]|uniref:putative uncharacterized protein C7orf78 homolog n=1 Tax=Mixophyes fleayi TaxID=3061075 RepID=UPI003F4DE8A2
MCANIKRLADSERCYFFERQVKFNANEKLTVERSENLVNRRPIPEYNIWRKKPPDFSVRLYKSLNLPRKSQEFHVEEKKNAAQYPKQRNGLEVIEDGPLPKLMDRKEPAKFLTRFKQIGPLEASIMCVKNGVYPKDKYNNQKPHDFRQYETGIPDFATSYIRDPFDLKFKSQRLSSLYEHAPLEVIQNREEIKRFTLHKPADPMWDSKLILPKSPWPPKSASYTRHRRRRGVYSAFMDRVEEKFTASNQEVSNILSVTERTS